jgi:CheY-like chemotaxis protein
MPVETLLLCRDQHALQVLRRVFQELEVQFLAADNALRAHDLITRRKFDAVVADCDDLPGARNVLQKVRSSSSNRTAIVFAIINGSTTVRQAYELGANFVLDKPLHYGRCLSTFRAAHGLMMRERRRYFRHEVNIPVTLHVGSAVQNGSITNLSEGGMAIRTSPPLPASGDIRLIFTLPGMGRQIDTRGEIAWNIGERAGIRLRFLPESIKAELAGWLGQSIEGPGPASVFINAARGQGWPGG